MAKVKKRGNSWQIDYTDPNGKRIRKAFRKKKEADAELAKRVSLIAEGRYLDVKKDLKITLGELVEKYLRISKNILGKRRCFQKSDMSILKLIETISGASRLNLDAYAKMPRSIVKCHACIICSARRLNGKWLSRVLLKGASR
jgi:hypothetical protein